MADSDHGSSRWLIVLVPVLAVVQVLAGSLHDLTGMGMSIPDRSAANDTPAVPAVYAFAIWGVLFAWLAAFAIFQARSDQRDNPLLASLRGPAALAFALNAVWEMNAQLGGLGWVSFAIIVALLLPLLLILERVRRFDAPIGRQELWLAVVPLHLLAGWISVATFASLSTTLDVTATSALGAPPLWRDAGLILLAGAVGTVFTLRARVPAPYAAAVGWGLLGIVVKNAVLTDNPLVAGSAALALLLLIGAAFAAPSGAARPPADLNLRRSARRSSGAEAPSCN